MPNRENVSTIDALEWFASFSNEERVSIVRSVVESIHKMDPDWSQCSAIWARGKTVRLTAAASVGPHAAAIGLHLVIEGNDPRLRRILTTRLTAGDLTFEAGWLQHEGKSEERAWMARLGMGTLAVYGERGEVIIKATHRQPLAVPGASGSQAIAALPLPPAEGFLSYLYDGQPLLVASFHGVSAGEIDAVRNVPIEIGVVPISDGLLLFGLKVPGLTDGWADLPFSLAVEQPENRRINPPEADGVGHLLLALIDRDTRRTVALRPLRLSTAFTSALHDLLDTQQDVAGRYTMTDYRRDLETSQRRWPKPSMIVEAMVARETVVAPR